VLQVLFRGVRELKKIQLMTVTRPKVVVECAGVQVSSEPIKNINLNANFSNPVQFVDLVRDTPPPPRHAIIRKTYKIGDMNMR